MHHYPSPTMLRLSGRLGAVAQQHFTTPYLRSPIPANTHTATVLLNLGRNHMRTGTNTIARRQLTSSSSSPLDDHKQKDPKPPSTLVPKKTWIQRFRSETWPHIKEEVVHYREGSKLLAFEVKLSFRYLLRLMRGNKLTRREYRQLRRTVSDLFRLVPFAILVAIPFAELALPVLLKLFPNMLPSTFEKSFDAEEKRKKMLKMRLEFAKFLQETVDEMAVDSKDKQHASGAQSFASFFRKIRTTGEPPETNELIHVAQQFENELTLENLSRPQLVSMCKYMGINAFGTDNFLRFQVRSKMRQLHADDQMIFFETVDSLTVPELQRACAERGIKTIGVSPARLRHDLQQWLDLHLIHKIPSSLLILSRAFIISDQPMLDKVSSDPSAGGEIELPKTTAEALQATLESLPPNLINEAELKLADQEGTASFKKKLEALKLQEEIIAEEFEQEVEAAEEARKRKEQLTIATLGTPSTNTSTTDDPSATPKLVIGRIVIEPQSDIQITAEQAKELGEAIKVLVAKSVVDTERVELDAIKDGRAESKKERETTEHSKMDPMAWSPVTATETDQPTENHVDSGEEAAAAAQKNKATSRLDSQVEKLLNKISAELEQYELDMSPRLPLIQANERGEITIKDLEMALSVIKSRPLNDLDIKKIGRKLDADGDGLVALHELMQLGHSAEDECEGHGIVVEREESSGGGEKKQKSS